ncbi:MalY/PatB family protein [Mediterraneibacter agrestimuris]|uniref:MalY/PatB family protein n=1 Tax=Mediterraneibacter agrestimuris TaxID=2941333 RepID=UPI0020411F30|nr:PatB family C-S lyase [Mediterraneibacter agrestimuris]
MKYNFDEVIDRSSNRSSKYDECVKKFGTQDVIPLWVADMDFRTAQPIIDACVEKAQEGIWGYTSRPDSYFEAVQEWEKKRNNWDTDTALMSWSLGVVPAMSSLIKIFSKTGDKIMIQTPVYSEFYDITEAWDRVVVENQLVEKDGNWEIDFEDFEEKVKECKIFLLCNPHNPLGIVWKPEELRRMAEICIANDVLLVSDEIHSDLIFHGKTHTPTATLSKEIAERIITCVSVTKTFNLAGLQASTTIFPNMEMKKAFDKFWGNMDVHRNNAFSSVAMEAAYREGEEWLEQLLEYVSGNFDFIKEYCEKNIPKIKPNLPDATYLVWLDCRKLGMDNEELRRFMIQDAKIGLNEGYTFGRSLCGFMRLNAACPRSVLEKALKQLEDAVNALN